MEEGSGTVVLALAGHDLIDLELLQHLLHRVIVLQLLYDTRGAGVDTDNGGQSYVEIDAFLEELWILSNRTEHLSGALTVADVGDLLDACPPLDEVEQRRLIIPGHVLK